MEKLSRVAKYEQYRHDISKMSLETLEQQQKVQTRDKLSKRLTNVKSNTGASLDPSLSYKDLLAGADSNIKTMTVSPYETIARKRKARTILLFIFSVVIDRKSVV